MQIDLGMARAAYLLDFLGTAMASGELGLHGVFLLGAEVVREPDAKG